MECPFSRRKGSYLPAPQAASKTHDRFVYCDSSQSPKCIGQTGPMSEVVKHESELPEQVEPDRFVYHGSLQRPTNNRQTHPRRGVVLTARLVLGEHERV